MYQIIYDYINNFLVGTISVQDVYINYLVQLMTHASIILIYIVLIKLVIWCFRIITPKRL